MEIVHLQTTAPKISWYVTGNVISIVVRKLCGTTGACLQLLCKEGWPCMGMVDFLSHAELGLEIGKIVGLLFK